MTDTGHVHVYPGPRNRKGLRAQLDEARRCAHVLRRALNDENPTRCNTIVDDLYHGGAEWLIPAANTLDPHEWLTAPDMAERFYINAATIRDWGTRRRIRRETRGGRTMYNVGDITTYRQYLNLKEQGLLKGVTLDQFRAT